MQQVIIKQCDGIVCIQNNVIFIPNHPPQDYTWNNKYATPEEKDYLKRCLKVNKWLHK